MEYTIRPARMEDHSQITSFTADTFSWGDYITRVYKDWIADPDGQVLVAALPDDTAVAMAKITMLSPTEAWAQGARVHPEHRRKGLASELHHELSAWAISRGAVVCRLLVEENNTPASKQVKALGFRVVSTWFHLSLGDVATGPVTEGNGGKRSRRFERLRAVMPGDATALFMGWAADDLYRASRGLIAPGWMMRRGTDEDFTSAASSGALFEGPSGAVMAAARDGDDGEALWVSWAATTADEAGALIRAIIDLARRRSIGQIEGILPELPWLREAFAEAGFATSRLYLYHRPLL